LGVKYVGGGRNLGKTFVIGVGNYLFGDEGVGVHVVKKLMELKLPEDVEVIDGGTGGVALLEFFEKADRVIVVDAALGGGEPGDVYVINPSQLEREEVRVLASLHEMNLYTLMEVAEELNILPEVIVVGVEPKEYNKMSTSLSREVEAALPKVIEKILELIY